MTYRRSYVIRHTSYAIGKPAAGFTIPELLVSMAIIGVMTGMMLANFRGGQQAAEARFSAEIITNQLHDIQTSALTGRLIAVCTGGGANDGAVCESSKPVPVVCGAPGTCQRRVPSGYGIRFIAGEKNYLVFYDTDNDGRYDEGEEFSTPPYVSTGTVLLDSADIGLPVDVVFKPPSGKMLFNGLETPDAIELTLRHATGNQIRHVKLLRISGKIEHD